MRLAAPAWVNVRLALGAAVAVLLVALSLFSPFDLRVKILVSSLLVTLGAVLLAAFRGSRATYQAAAFAVLASVTILLTGSFADTQNLLHLAGGGATAVGLHIVSLPRAPADAADERAPPAP